MHSCTEIKLSNSIDYSAVNELSSIIGRSDYPRTPQDTPGHSSGHPGHIYFQIFTYRTHLLRLLIFSKLHKRTLLMLFYERITATTNRREDPGRFTRKVGDGGASGLISPLLDHRI